MSTTKKSVEEVAALLRARCSFIWIASPEEGRIERLMVEVLKPSKREALRLWDCRAGAHELGGKPVDGGTDLADPINALRFIRDSPSKSLWVLKDFPTWLKDPYVLREARSLARSLPKRQDAPAVIVLSPSSDVPPELVDHTVVIKWPMPDREEIGRVFDNSIGSLDGDDKNACVAMRDAAVEAAIGLSAEQAATCFSKSLILEGRRINPALVAQEKKRAVSRERGIEWFDPDPRGMLGVGGLEALKAWLLARQNAYSERARAFGLPKPKGVMLLGVPGCGKSLTAKCIAAAWGVPLLRADLGSAQSKWVGESQELIRKVFATAEAIGRCVLWIDEIEKALGGATDGAADGGVAKDALGSLLSWMQERKGDVFVVATANDITKLPPELLRKGRFDELFFVDLPTFVEREEIVRVALKQHGRSDHPVDVREVARNSKDFTGSEVAALVEASLFAAFNDGERKLRTEDLVAAANVTVPLSSTMKEKITSLREWAKKNARNASKQEEVAAEGEARQLDL